MPTHHSTKRWNHLLREPLAARSSAPGRPGIARLGDASGRRARAGSDRPDRLSRPRLDSLMSTPWPNERCKMSGTSVCSLCLEARRVETLTASSLPARQSYTATVCCWSVPTASSREPSAEKARQPTRRPPGPAMLGAIAGSSCRAFEIESHTKITLPSALPPPVATIRPSGCSATAETALSHTAVSVGHIWARDVDNVCSSCPIEDCVGHG